MLVARYWSNGKARHADGKRRLTLQRWGWSNVSQEAADAHAQERLTEALDRALLDFPPRSPFSVLYGVRRSFGRTRVS